MTWTADRIAGLRRLWNAGKTAKQIAETLGGVSRNGVIGRAHRDGLSKRPSPIKRKVHAMPANTKTCEWPLVDTNLLDKNHKTTGWCGKKTAERMPYCPKHCKEAYRNAAQARAWRNREIQS